MGRKRFLGISILVIAMMLAMGIGIAGAQEKAVIGYQVDYERLTTIGPPVAQGIKDYIKLWKKKNNGGVINGVKFEFSECNHGYDVNRSLECYQRQKREGMISYSTFGTPHTYAITPKIHADKIPTISPGFGRADAMNGELFPYLFPAAATYWSQATAAIKYIQDAEGGKLKGKKIAYLYYDNPAGKEPIRILELLAEKYGFKLRTFGVPSPGVEMGAQVTDITRRFKADWVVAHLFGRAPSVSYKELVRKGFSLDHYIGFIWGDSETDVIAAGKDISKGMLSLQITGLGHDFPVLQEIKKMYADEGKPMHKHWDITGYYNRGVWFIGIQIEAVTQAIKAFGPPITGEKVKKGYEMISGFEMGGLFPPVTFTAKDHEGGGWVRMYQWNGTGFDLKRDWFKGDNDVIQKRLKEVMDAQKK